MIGNHTIKKGFLRQREVFLILDVSPKTFLYKTRFQG